jgi:acyl-coenzyme A thioesterase PaaI-like protein
VALRSAALGRPVGTGAIGFAKVPRRHDDLPKPPVTPTRFAALFAGVDTITRPIREAAGIEVIDPRNGEVELTVTPDLRNPAGTLQGALVALLAEAAAEELVSARFESPAVVTDLDLRYLAQAPDGPVRTRSRLLGTGPDSPVEIELTDVSVGRVTTLVYARCSRGGRST